MLLTLAFLGAITLKTPDSIEPGEYVQISIEGVTDFKKARVNCWPRTNVTLNKLKDWDDNAFLWFRAKDQGTYLLYVFYEGEYTEAILNVGKGNPKPDPTPVPVPNPYTPVSRWQNLVEPVLNHHLSLQDRTALATLYSDLSKSVRSKAVTTSTDLRAQLIQKGSQLGLKDKYKGLSQTIESIFQVALGLDNTTLTSDHADFLQTLAWEVYNAE